MYADLYCDQQGGLCCTDALSILHFAKLPDNSADKNQPLAPAGLPPPPFFLASFLFHLFIHLFAGWRSTLPESHDCEAF